MSNDQILETVYKRSEGRRFIVVIDDLWCTDAWEQMRRVFPNDFIKI